MGDSQEEITYNLSTFIQNPLYKEIDDYYKRKGCLLDIKELFSTDPCRFSNFHICLQTPSDGDILIDFSKNRINDEVLKMLLELAESKSLPKAISDLFFGERVNFTEQRPVMHIAFRNRSPSPVKLNNIDVMPIVTEELNHLKSFYNSVISGVWRGFTGKEITDIVTIGVSEYVLGSTMVTEALKPFSKGLKCHYVTNVDGTQLNETLKHIDYERVLFVIVSRQLSNNDTIMNMTSARNWLVEKTKNPLCIAKHFAAVSAIKNKEILIQFGIEGDNIFEIWEYVDNRYSIWSAASLPIIFSIGYDNFEQFLEGAHFMDVHFNTSNLNKSAPVILALISIWYVNFFFAQTEAIIPNEEYMRKFPSYIQQLGMQSNGKFINKYGDPVTYNTSPVIWGECGDLCKNSFGQIFHQGTRLIPCDFIASAMPNEVNANKDNHRMLLANFLGQSEALMLGKTARQVRAELFLEAGLIDKAELTEDEETLLKRRCEMLEEEEVNEEELAKINEIIKMVPHKVLSGNRPSNSIVVKKMTPFTLGALIALYEHKTYVQSIIWDINAFDKWGVELGRLTAENIIPQWEEQEETKIYDGSTNGMINFIKTYF